MIIARSGDLYTIAERGSRKQVPTGETYERGLADGQKYRVKSNSIKFSTSLSADFI